MAEFKEVVVASLELLGQLEGTKMHQVKGESFKTLPYGINTKAFPNTELEHYLNTTKDPNPNVIKLMVTEFYVKNFNSKVYANLNNFALAQAFFLISVNSETIANKALQKACIDLCGANIKADGIVGGQTLSAVEKAKIDFWDFLNYAKTYYIDEAVDGGKEDRHLKYVRGWNNRVDAIYKTLHKEK